MSQENVEVVRRILDRWGTGDFAGGADDVDSHVTLVVSEDFPEAGVFVGRTAIGQYLRRFLENWQRFSMEPERIVAFGDTVVAQVRQHGSGRDGVIVEITSFMLFTFRGATIVRIDSLLHENEAFEAVGFSE